LDPQNPRAWLNLAAAHNELGHLERAHEALQRLAQINPDHPDRHYNLAILHLKQGQTLKAMAELELELAAHPGHTLAQQLLERVRRQMM